MQHNPTWKSLMIVAFIAGLTAPVAVWQNPAKSAPATEVTWKRAVEFADGRMFVTDGSFTIDAALAKPATLPTDVLGEATGKVLQGYMTAKLENEYSLSQLATGPFPRSYVAPSGLVINALYVDYLRRTLSAARVRLRMTGTLQPVVILLDGKAVGLVMPMAGPKKQ